MMELESRLVVVSGGGRERRGGGAAVLEGSARGTPAVGMLSALTVRGAATCHRNRIGWPGTKQTHHRHR